MPLRMMVVSVALGTGAVLYGCSTYTSVSTTQIITKVAGDSQTAFAGTVLPVHPAVQITDSLGATVSGVTVVVRGHRRWRVDHRRHRDHRNQRHRDVGRLEARDDTRSQ